MVRFLALYSIFAVRFRLPPGSRVRAFQVYQVESSVLVRSIRYWFLLLSDLKNVCVLLHDRLYSVSSFHWSRQFVEMANSL